MQIFRVSRCRLSITVAFVLIAGCGGSQLPIGAPGAMAQSSTIAAHAERGGSWMLPKAQSQDFLYVTTSFAGIYVFDYPSGKLVNIITNYGPFSPQGLCTDRAGDVFITGRSEIAEYAHGGGKPIA